MNSKQRYEYLRRRGKVIEHTQTFAGHVALVRLTRPMTAYKKVRAFENGQWWDGRTVATLRIPKGALVTTAGGPKMRASRAKVVGFSRKGMKEARSLHAVSFKYRLGRVVRPCFAFDEDAGDMCASGIHFYLTFAGARGH